MLKEMRNGIQTIFYSLFFCDCFFKEEKVQKKRKLFRLVKKYNLILKTFTVILIPNSKIQQLYEAFQNSHRLNVI